MLIFAFVDFWCFLVVVVVVLCCYVVKLGKAKKNRNPKKRDPPKSGSTSGYFLQDKLWLHVPKLLFFFLGGFLVFLLVGQKHYKNRVF